MNSTTKSGWARIALLYAVLALFLAAPWIRSTIDNNRAIASNRTLVSSLQALAALKPPEPLEKKGVPVRIVMPRLNIDLDVEDGIYDATTQTWNVSETAVHYASQTSLVSDKASNTLIYGHRTWEVLARTENIVEDDLLYVFTDNGLKFAYRFVSEDEVRPNDTTIFALEAERPRLTMLTCKGYYNEVRRLIHFDLITVVKA